jgi:uncharacterized protein (DUF1810 family)
MAQRPCGSESLARFKQAQDAAGAGFAAAREELRAGEKRGHWIWYVFPQLAGLGRSPTARAFALAGLDEARAFALDPVLLPRLLEISSVAAMHLRQGRPLVRLLGSQVDALKLVSSMTLFQAIAQELHEETGDERHRALATVAGEILAVAASQGHLSCPYTLARLREAYPPGR